MKRFLLLFCLFCISYGTKAQHTVSGNISDLKDKTKLLDNVAVFIPDFNRFDISKEGGTYILRTVGIWVINLLSKRLTRKTAQQ